MKKKKEGKKRVSIFTVGFVCFIVIAIIVVLVLKKEDIKMNSLLKKDNIIMSKMIESKIESDVGSSQYINLTSDGVLYIFEDNGYNVGDRHRKLKLLYEKNVDTRNLESLKFEINNIMVVSPDDKIKDNGKVDYVEVTINGNTKTVYARDFYNVLGGFNIYIEGEENESF